MRTISLAAPFVTPLALVTITAIVSVTELPGQKAEDLVGIYRAKPGLVPSLVLDRILDREGPYLGRPMADLKFQLHESVPARVWLVKGKRETLYKIKGEPPLRKKQLITPGYLDLKLLYNRKDKRVHRFEVEEQSRKLYVWSHSGSLFKLPGYEICFLDLNHDGALGRLGDGYVFRRPKKGQWVKPGLDLKVYKMEDPFELKGTKLWLEIDVSGFRVVVSTLKPDFNVERRKEYQKGLAFLNAQRKKLGHDALELDESLTDPCEKHCLYCALNKVTTQDEEKGKPGYTKRGAKAAGLCHLLRATDVSDAIRSHLDSMFSRIRFLSPCSGKIGMGLINGYTALDLMTHHRQRRFEPFAWPHDGAENVPVTWTGPERPHPLGGKEGMSFEEAQKYGYPISLTFPSADVKDVKVRLVPAEGGPSELHVSSPEEPAHEMFSDNRRSVFIMSKRPLRPRTKYVVTVDCTFMGKPFRKEWMFTTQ